MRKKFEVFDPIAFAAPPWIPKFLDNAFIDPKGNPMWDARKPDQLERLQALALGIKQFLAQLPDGAEIGTASLAERLHPNRTDDKDFMHFLYGRIERCRFAELINDHFYTLPDNRWKKPRKFYKYHNGKGKLDAEL